MPCGSQWQGIMQRQHAPGARMLLHCMVDKCRGSATSTSCQATHMLQCRPAGPYAYIVTVSWPWPLLQELFQPYVVDGHASTRLCRKAAGHEHISSAFCPLCWRQHHMNAAMQQCLSDKPAACILATFIELFQALPQLWACMTCCYTVSIDCGCEQCCQG